MLLIDGTFSFATPFCACIFNKHSNALHFILEPGQQLFIYGAQHGLVRLVKKTDAWDKTLIWSQHLRWRIIKKIIQGRIIENRLYYRKRTYGQCDDCTFVRRN
jgi:hypothetical protein